MYQHHRARVRSGGRTHQSDIADAGAWGWTSAGIGQEHTSGASVTLSRSRNFSQCVEGRRWRHGHEKASKGLASLQAMNPAMERKYTAPPPDLTRDKV